MANTGHENVHGDQKYHKTEVPYAEITLCCGFLLVYFIEELVLALAKEEEMYVSICINPSKNLNQSDENIRLT